MTKITTHMKKLILIALICFTCSPAVLHAKSRTETVTFHSEILGVDKKFSVYLPDGYDTGNDFPVFYMLHGSGGYCEMWFKKYGLQTIADWRISSGMAVPMVCIMPDAQGDDPKTHRGKHLGYFNYDDGWNYEDFFFRELIPYVESHFKVRTDRGGRAITGISMGGGGAIIYGMRHPEMFNSVCPIIGRAANYEEVLERKSISERDSGYISKILENDMYRYLKDGPAERQQSISELRWMLCCGDDDYMLHGNLTMYMLMKELKFPQAQLRVSEGRHSGEFARLMLPEILTYVSIGFELSRHK